MPIRVGSGGLKYPLPSQSQIQAQQNAAAASAGGSAAAAVYGDNRRFASENRKLRYDAYQSQTERDFKAEQAFYQREHEMGGQLNAQDARAGLQANQLAQQKLLQEKAQAFQGDQAQLGRDFQAQQLGLGRDFQVGRDAARFANQQEIVQQGEDARIQQAIATGKAVLPPATQQELQKLEAGKAQMKNLTPDQQVEFQQKYDAEKRRLLRTASAPAAPTASARFNQGVTYVDPQGQGFSDPGPGRTAYIQQGKGKWEPIVDQAKINAAQAKDQAKATDARHKGASKIMGEVDEKTAKTRSFEQALSEYDRRRKLAAGSPLGTGEADPHGDPPVGPQQQMPAEAPAAPLTAAQAPPQPMGGQGQPAGVPPNSQMIDNNTIQLPDGRVFRPKKKQTP